MCAMSHSRLRLLAYVSIFERRRWQLGDGPATATLVPLPQHRPPPLPPHRPLHHYAAIIRLAAVVHVGGHIAAIVVAFDVHGNTLLHFLVEMDPLPARVGRHDSGRRRGSVQASVSA